jgi:hypothetical protein
MQLVNLQHLTAIIAHYPVQYGDEKAANLRVRT